MRHIEEPTPAQAELLAYYFERKRRTARHPFHRLTATRLRDIYAGWAGLRF